MEMLRQGSHNVSEVSYKVGFSSTSYFIKCFREYYGFPPGEVGNRESNETNTSGNGRSWKKRLVIILGTVFLAFCLAAVLFIIFKPIPTKHTDLEKSIAVLPFIDDSNDPSNVHIINGLMESILNNLQNIEELRVISRRSVEKYRDTPKTIPEIARELNVNYFIEGSGQKIGDNILLNIQLIEAPTDRHLWAEQYNRKAEDIFNLQMEIAKNVADKIEVIITPEVEERINKVPTKNLEAYDLFLKGLDLFHKGGPDNWNEAIGFYQKALEHDNEFARAYAGIAIAYYFLDIFQAEKKYTDQINNYADKALLFDSQLPQSLIAKALYYMNSGESESALSYLEKALEYNPNSALVINILSDFYANYDPDTEKYLEYALKGIRLDIATNDSVTTSYIYLHLSNALV
jgi:TolB-like protein